MFDDILHCDSEAKIHSNNTIVCVYHNNSIVRIRSALLFNRDTSQLCAMEVELIMKIFVSLEGYFH